MTEVILRTRNRHGLSAGAGGTLNVLAKTKVGHGREQSLGVCHHVSRLGG